MVVMSEEARHGKYIKFRPSVLKKAGRRAVSSDKSLGQWLEDIREEKIEREQKKVK